VPTVAGALAAALERILRLPAPPPVTAAGRTDAGVHAQDQWVHVDLPSLPSPAELDDLHRRLVKMLAPSVVVRSVSAAPPGWDARRSALSRTYRYTVLNRELPDPFLAGFAWHVPAPLDVGAMELACDAVIGEHDFSSFCRRPGRTEDGVSLVRNVLGASWTAEGDGIVRFEVTAGAFCQQMVRSLVGTMVEVGLGKRRAGEIAAVLRARDRTAAAAPAPPEGLCLWAVTYPPE